MEHNDNELHQQRITGTLITPLVEFGNIELHY